MVILVLSLRKDLLQNWKYPSPKRREKSFATTYSYGSPVGMNQLEAKRLILLENMSLYSRPQYMANAPFIRIM